jgi:hypothetical protein
MNDLSEQERILRERDKLIHELVRAGYTESHGKYMANLLYPTPAQQRMAKARASRGKGNGRKDKGKAGENGTSADEA